MIYFVFKIKRIFVAILCAGIIISTVNVNGQEAWSLDSCIKYAHTNNLNILQQELGVKMAEQDLKQSRIERFPTFNVNAAHVYNYGRTIDPFTNEFITESVRKNDFSLSSGIVLFDGFRIKNTIERNNLELSASQHDVGIIKKDISLRIASAYLEILFNKELIEMLEGQLDVIHQQLERTKRLVEVGTLSRGNLYTLQAQAASDGLQLTNAENQLHIAYINLMQMLDLRDTDDFSVYVPDDIDIDVESLSDLSPVEIYDESVNIQPGVKASDIRAQRAEKDVEIARGMKYPVLALQGSLGTGYSSGNMESTDVPVGQESVGVTDEDETIYETVYDTQVIPFTDQLDRNFNQSIGLYLTIPIFNNYQARTAINRSKIELENSRLENRIERELVFKEIQQIYADANVALKKYEANKKNVDALEENFNHTEERFNVGKADPIEYNDAKNRLDVAKSQVLQAKYEFLFKVKIIDFYMGAPLTLND